MRFRLFRGTAAAALAPQSSAASVYDGHIGVVEGAADATAATLLPPDYDFGGGGGGGGSGGDDVAVDVGSGTTAPQLASLATLVVGKRAYVAADVARRAFATLEAQVGGMRDRHVAAAVAQRQRLAAVEADLAAELTEVLRTLCAEGAADVAAARRAAAACELQLAAARADAQRAAAELAQQVGAAAAEQARAAASAAAERAAAVAAAESAAEARLSAARDDHAAAEAALTAAIERERAATAAAAAERDLAADEARRLRERGDGRGPSASGLRGELEPELRAASATAVAGFLESLDHSALVAAAAAATARADVAEARLREELQRTRGDAAAAVELDGAAASPVPSPAASRRGDGDGDAVGVASDSEPTVDGDGDGDGEGDGNADGDDEGDAAQPADADATTAGQSRSRVDVATAPPRAAGSTSAGAGPKSSAPPRASAATPAPSSGAASGSAATRKLKEQEALVRELRARVRALEAAGGGRSPGGAPPPPDDRAVQEAVDRAKAQWERKAKKERDEADKVAKREADGAARKAAKAAADLSEATSAVAALTIERDDLKRRGGAMLALEKELEATRAAAEAGRVAAAELAASTVKVAELGKLYHDEQLLRKKYWNMLEDLKGKIRVYARVRPIAASETERGCETVITVPDSLSLELRAAGREPKNFTFDSVFGVDSTQEQVFADTEGVVQSALDGYNVAVFAYGQTGSGKTFTMVGAPGAPGITPRAVHRLFSLIEGAAGVLEVSVTCTMVELYLDNLVDLLWKPSAPREEPPRLDIKKDDKGLVNVRGAVVRPCATAEEVLAAFAEGNAARHVGSTAMNATSSRSHLVFSLCVSSRNAATRKTATGKLSLIDLAGSEKQSKTGATGDRLKEAQAINTSLSALGNVIAALSAGDKFIPYRDNKLTQLMSDSLGGNAKTLMFVNVSPVDYNSDESASSLAYAARVKTITNNAERNQESAEVARLKRLIARLRAGDLDGSATPADSEPEPSDVSGDGFDGGASTPGSRAPSRAGSTSQASDDGVTGVDERSPAVAGSA